MAVVHKLKLLATSLAVGIVGYSGWRVISGQNGESEAFEVSAASKVKEGKKTHRELIIPTRAEQIKYLQSGEQYDILVIGGGVTGCGVALDATTRGLNVALVEGDDFSSGTSSRSTKLIHGGVRYLQKAILGLDWEQYRLVKEALHERANLLEIAPHLSHPLPIMLPVYKWWQIPYFWAGIKMYDLVAGKKVVKSSFFVSKSKALEEFPMLQANKLCGAIVYYDGQHNDARMNLAIALTAAREGAKLANHVEVLSLIKEKDIVKGVHVRDQFTGNEWNIFAKVVVNATGPCTDIIRQMDDPSVDNICQPSAGVHVVVPDYYSPRSMGLLDPSTSDGRVIFFLPWEGKTIAGTTDSPTEVTHYPSPTEEDIRFILKEIKDYLSPDLSVRRGDVLAAWSGIRPLVSDPNSKDTQSISRNHVIEVSKSKMVTIAGGKWTTYRAMSRDTVDKAVEVGGLNDPRGCQTDGFILEGGEAWQPTSFIRLVQDYGIEVEVAHHLAKTYGDKAPRVADLASFTGRRWPVKGKRLVEEFPYIEADVLYAIKEYACTAVDVIARRTSLAFLNVQAAEDALPRVIEIMGKELGWNKDEQKKQMADAKLFLQTMGFKVRHEVRNVEIKLSYQEAKRYTEIFKSLDKDKDGHISIYDLKRALKDMGESVSDKELRDLIAEVDINKNATIEEEEFLQLMSGLKTGEVANSRMAEIVRRKQEHMDMSVRRSGGGV